ncbi:hypothetical protein HNY73_020222 [Argiope bruennichi]|uniref:Uncharacterized protein n=1 Tax=Argiope bruennichi TaxID=94029 RepID=A0A8T0E793_ARGBR|nr:hypothetical protein HNY73_020222 [Argiope bruennichi]
MISQAFILATLAVAAFASLHYEPIHHPQTLQIRLQVKDKHGKPNMGKKLVMARSQGKLGIHRCQGNQATGKYVADHGGFRAEVKNQRTGKPPTRTPAAVHIISDAPYGHGGYAGDAGLGYTGIYGAGLGYARNAGYGYAGLGVNGLGYGYAGLGGYGGYGYGGNGLLGGLGYARYGF